MDALNGALRKMGCMREAKEWVMDVLAMMLNTTLKVLHREYGVSTERP